MAYSVLVALPQSVPTDAENGERAERGKRGSKTSLASRTANTGAARSCKTLLKLWGIACWRRSTSYDFRYVRSAVHRQQYIRREIKVGVTLDPAVQTALIIQEREISSYERRLGALKDSNVHLAEGVRLAVTRLFAYGIRSVTDRRSHKQRGLRLFRQHCATWRLS